MSATQDATRDAVAEATPPPATADDRRGGLDVWSPSVTPPIGVDLTDEQALACTFRILARDGFSENIVGPHHLAAPGDETMWVNPWGLWWAR